MGIISHAMVSSWDEWSNQNIADLEENREKMKQTLQAIFLITYQKNYGEKQQRKIRRLIAKVLKI